MFVAFITITLLILLIPLFGHLDLFKLGCNDIISKKCLTSGIINILFLILYIIGCCGLSIILLRLYDGHRYRNRKYKSFTYLFGLTWLINFGLIIPYLTTGLIINNFLTNALAQLSSIMFGCYMMCLVKIVKF